MHHDRRPRPRHLQDTLWEFYWDAGCHDVRPAQALDVRAVQNHRRGRPSCRPRKRGYLSRS